MTQADKNETASESQADEKAEWVEPKMEVISMKDAMSGSTGSIIDSALNYSTS